MGDGDDDRESQAAVRALILERRRRFIAAAVAGLGIAGSTGCDAFAPPAPEHGGDTATGGSPFGPPGTSQRGFGVAGGFADPSPIPDGNPPPADPPPNNPSSATDEDCDREPRSADDDAGVAEPCVCLSLSLVDEPSEPDGLG